MYNYFVKIEYDGTNYVGWQNQKNGKSVQQVIEKALKKILKSKIKLIGAGRTDKGVHAYGQCANFKVKEKIANKKKFINSINFFLQKKFISILDIKEKDINFHSRYSAKERVYEYHIVNRLGSLSIYKNKAWHIKKKLDIKILKKGAEILQGEHDFSTFRASSCTAKSPIKKMKLVKIKKSGEKILILFKSKSFLQNQVRSMVGCLNYISLKKWTIKKFIKILKSKQRSMCAPPAPAHGLYLKEIKY